MIPTSRRGLLKLIGGAGVASSIGVGTVAASEGPGGETLAEFEQMTGNTLTGGDGAIRRVNAGGLPWVVDDAEAKLDTDGRLKVEVEGLVIDPAVDHPAAGTNPIDSFRATVSSLTLDRGMHVVDNVQTGRYPASDDGDAKIEERVSLPDPALAPIVFVTHPNGAWFAVTSV